MNWSRIHLIFCRELRDQLRDRRTMFTIFVLPLLLYPFMGMLMMQVAQFRTEHPVKITWIGEEQWPSDDRLVEPKNRSTNSGLIQWTFLPYADVVQNRASPPESDRAEAAENRESETPSSATLAPFDWKGLSELLIGRGEADLVFITHPGIGEAIAHPNGQWPMELYLNQASEQSVIASQRLHRLLDRWQRHWIAGQLRASAVDPAIIEPIEPRQFDLAPRETKHALIWSKLLPLVMLVWALTGAFYPAIDLCAGEKERGTLETLLSSPASRREIVWGKLLTVMSFSVATATLNLLSMQWTSSFIIGQFSRMGATDMVSALGPLPLSALTWLFVILLPISTMFSALALAVAALARSSKEGQYYLMPLLLAGLPLVMLPMLPGLTLTIGSSAIPVTGAVLLARSLIEGHYRESMLHAPIVIGVTIICCLLAVRWAVRQFENESVMFRESERFQWSLWLRQIWRERSATATANEALLCGVVILVALFFGRLALTSDELTWMSLTRSTIAIQLGMILAPCLIMATFMTASIRQALRLEPVQWSDLAVATLLGITLHPGYMLLSAAIQNEFPLGSETQDVLRHIDGMISSAPFWSVLLFLAVFPAICEELAFRGFIFGGLMRQDGILRAILVSSLFFGLSHGVLQQTIGATVMGFVLGLIAWRSGGVVCGIALHLTHNSLTMLVSRVGKAPDSLPESLSWVLQSTPEGGLGYSPTWMALSLLCSAAGLSWFAFRPWFRGGCSAGRVRSEAPLSKLAKHSV